MTWASAGSALERVVQADVLILAVGIFFLILVVYMITLMSKSGFFN